MKSQYRIVIKPFDSRDDALKISAIIGRVLANETSWSLPVEIESFNPDAVPV